MYVTAAIAIYLTLLIDSGGLSSNVADLNLNLCQHFVLSFLMVSFLHFVPDFILLHGVFGRMGWTGKGVLVRGTIGSRHNYLFLPLAVYY